MQTRMSPDLVCKITVQTPENKAWRGSGYPITPNRIITAAHVVADAAYIAQPPEEGAARQITLAFGSTGETVAAPVSLVWCDTTLDVAVLACQLPPKFQPAHELLIRPPETPLEWHAQGYTEFGKTARSGGKDAYRGKLPQISLTEALVPLDCEDGPVTSEQWKGGSGSVAFDSATSQTALAVITDYQSGKKLDQLMAVPLCYLLHSAATRESFRRAIQFEAYERRRNYRDEVIEVVATKLGALEEKTLDRVIQALNPLLPREARVGDKLKAEARAAALATAMVSQAVVTDVVARLVGLMDTLKAHMAEPIAEIIDYVLPLNYAPGVIQRLREQLATDPCGLVENEVSTRSLAEIIMAGFDHQPAKFVALTDGSEDVRGKTALDYCEGPENGPDVLSTADSLLCDLVALKGTLLGVSRTSLRRTQEHPRSEAELVQKIQANAKRLAGTLTGVSKMHNGRTVYCVLPPSKGAPTRDFQKQVLRIVRESLQPHVRQFIFVELMEEPSDARESEVGAYITTRVLRAQP